MSMVIPAPLAPARSRLFRYTRRDALPAVLAVLHGAALLAGASLLRDGGMTTLAASAALVALGTVWSSNTIAHVHLHTPLFRSRALSRGFSLFLSATLGIPQSVWRARHLAHHAGATRRRAVPAGRLALELVAIAATWGALLALAPRFFLLAVLPGFAVGLLLCQVSGVYEHRHAGQPVPAGVSHYGALYNLTWLNDGHHAEHHARPAVHWTRLGAVPRPEGAAVSTRAPLLRVLDEALVPEALCALERLVLRSAWLQRVIVDVHARAIARVASGLPSPRRVAIVGGGLFPRTALVARRLFPHATVVVIDRSEESIATARSFLARHGHAAPEFVHAAWEPGAEADFDLVFVPLALVAGSGRPALARAAAPLVVHEWAWRRSGAASAVIAPWLLKRVSLVLPTR